MIRRRVAAAEIRAPIGNHTFPATGITPYQLNGGTLEHAQEMAPHESPRTTKLYDRTKERLTQDEYDNQRVNQGIYRRGAKRPGVYGGPFHRGEFVKSRDYRPTVARRPPSTALKSLLP
jgi:hypothetical protein